MSNILIDNSSTDPIELPVPVRRKKFVFTDEQIKALPSNQIELLPTPAPGTMIVPNMAIFSFNLAAGYQNLAYEDNGGITVFFVDGLTPSRYTSTSDSLKFFGPNFFQLVPFTETYTASDVEVIGGTANAGETRPLRTNRWQITSTPVKLTCDNYTLDYNTNLGNFTGGDPANTMSLTLLYSIIEL